jgi:hypothetical protein
VGRDAPVDARRLAARGALPLPALELATVLFALMHDADAQVKSTARESLEGLPPQILAGVVTGDAHPALLSHLAHARRDDAELLEMLALNPAASDETIAFLAGLPHRRVVEIVANNQQRILRCPGIVDALGANPLTGRAAIDRILAFLGLERPAAEVSEDGEPFEALGDDAAGLARELIEEADGELDEAQRTNLFALVQSMNVMQKIKLARMGNKEARGLLVRDTNKIVATAAIRSPKLTENEVVQFARSRNLCDEVIRVIASNRDFTRHYAVKLGLATNPKTPQPTAMKLLNYLQDKDLRGIMKSKDVPSAVSNHARRILSKKGKV